VCGHNCSAHTPRKLVSASVSVEPAVSVPLPAARRPGGVAIRHIHIYLAGRLGVCSPCSECVRGAVNGRDNGMVRNVMLSNRPKWVYVRLKGLCEPQYQ